MVEIEIKKQEIETIEKNEKEEKKEFPELEEAKKKITELEEVNKRMEENIKKAERLAAESILRGRALAGQKPKTEEEKIADEAEVFANAMGRSFRKI